MTRQSLTNVCYESSNLADVQSTGFFSSSPASATGSQRASVDNRLTALPIRSNAGYRGIAGVPHNADTPPQQEESAQFGSDYNPIKAQPESADIDTVTQVTQSGNHPAEGTSKESVFAVRMHPYLYEGADLKDAEVKSRFYTDYTLRTPAVWYKCVTVGAKTKEEEANAAGFTNWFEREVEWRLKHTKFEPYTPPGTDYTASENLSAHTHQILGVMSRLYNDTLYDIHRKMENKDFEIEIVDRKTLEESKGDLDDKTFYNDRVPMPIERYDDKVRKNWHDVVVLKIEGPPESTKFTVMPRDYRSYMGTS